MPFLPALLNLLLPPLCLACDVQVAEQGTLCATCWSKIHFIVAPHCSCCGTPFDAPVGDGLLCAVCIARPPLFAAARAAMLYDDASRGVVLGFKHGDRTHLAATLAQWMQNAGRDVLPGTDALIPVPLHRWRLFCRRYNQAALLATQIGTSADTPVWVDALARGRATPTQGHRNRKERQANVKNAFRLRPSYAETVKNRNLVLIDDVLTTGATLDECSRVLLDAGARSVKALTLARVKNYA